MSKAQENWKDANLLRQRAEDALYGKPVDFDGLPIEDIQKLVHELQVHQMELTLQNEELRRVQLELETARDLYSQLYDFAPVGYCTLSRKDTILEVNHTLTALLGVRREELLGKRLSHFVEHSDQDQYYLYCQLVLESHQRQISEVHMLKGSGEKIDIRLESIVAPGKEDRLWVTLSDITRQQQIEKDAQEALLLREVQHLVAEQHEQERMQVARDLHDGPVQELVAITFALRGMLMDHPRSELAAQLEAIQTDLQEQIRALRAYSIELRPPMLARFGLAKMIRSHAEIFQEKHPTIQIKLELLQTEILLPEKASLALFRIYQEALNNILKHVQRHEIQVTLRLAGDEHQMCLEIQDNGQGFVLPEHWIDLVHEGHLGLVGMRERAEAVNGQLEIHSQQGEGTRLVVIVPL